MLTLVLWGFTLIGELAIFRSPNVHEAFICTNKGCDDLWPDNWDRMYPKLTEEGIHVFVANISGTRTTTITGFKARMIYFNRSYQDSKWIDFQTTITTVHCLNRSEIENSTMTTSFQYDFNFYLHYFPPLCVLLIILLILCFIVNKLV